MERVLPITHVTVQKVIQVISVKYQFASHYLPRLLQFVLVTVNVYTKILAVVTQENLVIDANSQRVMDITVQIATFAQAMEPVRLLIDVYVKLVTKVPSVILLRALTKIQRLRRFVTHKVHVLLQTPAYVTAHMLVPSVNTLSALERMRQIQIVALDMDPVYYLIHVHAIMDTQV
jgi:hypothetical protein